MPSQNVAGFPAIRSFPVQEQFGFIWVWMGDPERASLRKILPMPWAEDPEWTYSGGVYNINSDYRLMVDNLMDLTHENYIHTSSIGQSEIEEVPAKTRIEGGEVSTSRFMENILAPPFWRMALRSANLPDGVLVDRWQVSRFSLPSHVMVDVGVAIAGRGGHEADRSVKVSATVVNFITPETEASHWYFWGLARNFAIDDPGLTETIRKAQSTIFSEDVAMLEQQQITLGQYPGRELQTVSTDAGGHRARGMIDVAIREEEA